MNRMGIEHYQDKNHTWLQRATRFLSHTTGCMHIASCRASLTRQTHCVGIIGSSEPNLILLYLISFCLFISHSKRWSSTSFHFQAFSFSVPLAGQGRAQMAVHLWERGRAAYLNDLNRILFILFPALKRSLLDAPRASRGGSGDAAAFRWKTTTAPRRPGRPTSSLSTSTTWRRRLRRSVRRSPPLQPPPPPLRNLTAVVWCARCSSGISKIGQLSLAASRVHCSCRAAHRPAFATISRASGAN